LDRLSVACCVAHQLERTLLEDQPEESIAIGSREARLQPGPVFGMEHGRTAFDIDGFPGLRDGSFSSTFTVPSSTTAKIIPITSTRIGRELPVLQEFGGFDMVVVSGPHQRRIAVMVCEMGISACPQKHFQHGQVAI
jgi:hypothetical protein